jgi:hypothetical protein
VTSTDSGTEDGYGHSVMTPAETTGVPCRYSRPRYSEMLDETGQRRRIDGKLFIKFAASIDVGCTIKDVKDAAGADVVTGEFEVLEVVNASSRAAGHHKEVLVRRA